MVKELHDSDRERLEGAEVVANVSGGKDSTALSLWLTEHGIEHRRVFADTGWEAAQTYEHLEHLEKRLGPIDRVAGRDGGMPGLVRRKGMFPSRKRRFCTDELKIKPLHAYLDEINGDVVSVIGVRGGESASRARLPKWDHYRPKASSAGWYVWRPLIDWTEQDVIDTHTRHGLAPNPLYMRGASRVGCWPCIFSRKREIRLVADIDERRIDEIRELEAEVARAAELRSERDSKPRPNPPGYFQRPTRLPDGSRPCTPIDEVVEWARTDRGGRQMLLLAPEPEDEGCMRWGLCEHDSSGDEWGA